MTDHPRRLDPAAIQEAAGKPVKPGCHRADPAVNQQSLVVKLCSSDLTCCDLPSVYAMCGIAFTESYLFCLTARCDPSCRQVNVHLFSEGCGSLKIVGSGYRRLESTMIAEIAKANSTATASGAFARLLLVVMFLLLPGVALAEEPWTPLSACSLENWNDVEGWRQWNSHTPPNNAENWVEEKARYENRRDVWRWLDRLYIGMPNGKVLTLADCPFGDDLHFFLYERFDEAGNFHVVNVWRYEEHYFALVMRNSGIIYTVSGLPVWSPDRSRFAYAVCDLMNGTEEIAVMNMVDDRPVLNAKAELPCTIGECKLDWENNTTVKATCEGTAESGATRSITRLRRQGDRWISTKTPR